MWPAVVSHRDLTVTDGERSAARYADVLGLRRLRRTGFDDHPDAVEYARCVCPPRSPWSTSAVTGP